MVTLVAFLSLNQAPRVVRGRVTLDGGSLVIGESDVLLACGVVADSRALGVVGIPYPRIISLSIPSRLTRNSLRSLVSFVTLVSLEKRPCVFGRVCAFLLGELVDGYPYVSCRRRGLLVHRVAVGVVRIGNPRPVLGAVLSLLARYAVRTLNQRPCVVGRIVAFKAAFPVIGETDVFLSGRVVGKSVALSIIRIAYPCVQGLAVLAVCTRNSFGTLFTVYAVSCYQLVFRCIHFARKKVSAVSLSQTVAVLVGKRPVRRIVRACLHRTHEGRIPHADYPEIRDMKPGIPSAHVLHGFSGGSLYFSGIVPSCSVPHPQVPVYQIAVSLLVVVLWKFGRVILRAKYAERCAVLTVLPLVHLKQPVGITHGRFAVRAAFIDAEPYTPVM